MANDDSPSSISSNPKDVTSEANWDSGVAGVDGVPGVEGVDGTLDSSGAELSEESKSGGMSRIGRSCCLNRGVSSVSEDMTICVL